MCAFFYLSVPAASLLDFFSMAFLRGIYSSNCMSQLIFFCSHFTHCDARLVCMHSCIVVAVTAEAAFILLLVSLGMLFSLQCADLFPCIWWLQSIIIQHMHVFSIFCFLSANSLPQSFSPFYILCRLFRVSTLCLLPSPPTHTSKHSPISETLSSTSTFFIWWVCVCVFSVYIHSYPLNRYSQSQWVC